MEPKEYRINPLKAWYLKKRCYMKSRPMIKQIQQDGKKYLIIIMCGWRGKKWSKRFEIVSELDESCNPIPFSGIVVNSDQHYAHDTEQKIKKGSGEQQSGATKDAQCACCWAGCGRQGI